MTTKPTTTDRATYWFGLRVAAKTKHTPGQWRVGAASGTGEPDSMKQYNGRPYQEHSEVTATIDGFTKIVAHVYQGDGGVGSPRALSEQLANTRLMASAPDMLAALNEIKSFLRTIQPESVADYGLITGALREAHTAIALATGVPTP